MLEDLRGEAQEFPWKAALLLYLAFELSVL